MPPPKSPTAVVVIAERARRGWTQTDLANALVEATGSTFWSRNKVRRIEAGEQVISVDVLQALAKVLDVDYATLIEGFPRVRAVGSGGQLALFELGRDDTLGDALPVNHRYHEATISDGQLPSDLREQDYSGTSSQHTRAA